MANTDMTKDEVKQQRKMYKEYIDAEKDRLERKQDELIDDVWLGAADGAEYTSVGIYNTGIFPKWVAGRVIAEGNRFFSEAKMLATKSDAEICKYYANYESNVMNQRKEVANWLKTEDRRQEEIQAYENNLQKARVQQSSFEAGLQAHKTSSDRFTNTIVNGIGDMVNDLQGNMADYLSLDY